MAAKPKSTGGASDSAGATDFVDAEVIKGPGAPSAGDGDAAGASPTAGNGASSGAPERVGDLADAPGREGPGPDRPALHGTGSPLGIIDSPETAVATLKEKVSLLHTYAHNVTHAGTLAFNEAEQLVADVRWLLSYLRAKV